VAQGLLGAIPPGAGPLITIRGVERSFEGGDATGPRRVLGPVDLDVETGAFVTLIGPSGCGKSTLLRIVGDLVAPSAGSVLVNGKTPAQARLDRDYGIVFQSPVLFDWRTVAENVALPLEVFGWAPERRDARVAELLSLVELEGFAGHRPYQLSGGMQQRVAIARALSFSPRILLMDEPFGALDELTRERLNDEVRRIWRSTGTTVVFVTHSIPEAVYLSMRVLVMSTRPGRFVLDVAVDLPEPRDDATRESGRLFELVNEVREALHRGSEAVPAP
jgi:NitT/TauT family transport system ATP-binding protein